MVSTSEDPLWRMAERVRDGDPPAAAVWEALDAVEDTGTVSNLQLDANPMDVVLTLLQNEASPAVALDYTMVSYGHYSTNEWALLRNRTPSTISENVRKALSLLDTMEDITDEA